jgi:hypothetical protein
MSWNAAAGTQQLARRTLEGQPSNDVDGGYGQEWRRWWPLSFARADDGGLAAASGPWQVVAVRWIVTFVLGAAVLGGCKERAPSVVEIVDRGWRAHELVVAAGEQARTCAEAGPAMQRMFAVHRRAFVDAIAIDRDRQQLTDAIDYIEANQRRYGDLETRMAALSERCAEEPSVEAAFAMMESP